MKTLGLCVLSLLSPFLVIPAGARADTVTVTVHQVSAAGQAASVGEVVFEDTDHGLLVRPDLARLAPGPAGAHIHERPDCGPKQMDGHTMPAGAAGGHLDPHGTGVHAGPYGDGHLGDLPNLMVEADGRARIPVLAPRLRVRDIVQRALVVHGGADRYTDHAAHHHGKGGGRLYCGVIE